jgi:hypothetical protein
MLLGCTLSETGKHKRDLSSPENDESHNDKKDPPSISISKRRLYHSLGSHTEPVSDATAKVDVGKLVDNGIALTIHSDKMHKGRIPIKSRFKTLPRPS